MFLGIYVQRLPRLVLVLLRNRTMRVLGVTGRHLRCSFNNKILKEIHNKCAVIVDYNSKMGAVDKKDQMLEPYLIERKKCQKWYKKMFKRLLNASILNSRIIVHKSSEDEAKQLAFRLDLVDKIIKRHLNLVPVRRQREVSNRNHDLPETRFVGSHYIVRNGEETERFYLSLP